MTFLQSFFGKSKKVSKVPSKSLKERAKKRGIKLTTKKADGSRKYKTSAQLKAQLKK